MFVPKIMKTYCHTVFKANEALKDNLIEILVTNRDGTSNKTGMVVSLGDWIDLSLKFV